MLGPKALGGPSILQDFLGSAKPPPGFRDLFNVDIESSVAKKWWDNNLRSIVDAFQRGDRTWVYYDKRGNAYELPFTPSLMNQMDMMNVTYARDGLRRASNAKDAQRWTGLLITATKALERRGGQYTMDVYEKTWADIERAKERALAGSRYAEYANLVQEQTQLARYILGLSEGDPLDPNRATNPLLTADQRSRIARDLAAIAPRIVDETSEFSNPNGDPVLGLMADGGIQTVVDADGNIAEATLDPNRGYLTQGADGRVVLNVVDPAAPGSFVIDPQTGVEKPAYLDATVGAMVRYDGEDVEVRQPISDGDSLPVYAVSGTTPMVGKYSGVTNRPGESKSVDPYIQNGARVALPVRTVTTFERGKPVRWVTVDGVSWLRYVPGEGPAPRIVLEPGVTYDPDKKVWMKGGKEVDPTTDKLAHWWGPEDARAAGGGGPIWGFGAPGANYTTTPTRSDGRFDARPDWMLLSDAERKAGLVRGDLGAIRQQAWDDPWEDNRQFKARLAAPHLVEAEGRRAGGQRNAADVEPTRKGQPGWGPTGGGELAPVALRTAPSLLQTPGKKLALEFDTRRDVGVKPPPAPVLKPAATPSLLEVQPADKKGLGPFRDEGFKLAPLPKTKKKKVAKKPVSKQSLSEADKRRKGAAKPKPKPKPPAAPKQTYQQRIREFG